MALTNVRFEAFDQDGDSLGVLDAGDLADDQLQGSTAEDRFFGVTYGNGVSSGVSSLRITNEGGAGIEIDHVQFANCAACCERENPGDLTLSGFSYVDVNNDGVFQDAELPLLGVEVQLTGTDTAGNDVQATTFTNGLGFYRFAGLAAGSYTVRQVQPVPFVDGQDTLGNLGGDDSTNDAFTIPLNAHAEEYNFGELGLRAEHINKRLYLASSPYSQWQAIDVREFPIWYSFDAAHAAFLDIQAEVGQGDVMFSLFDENMKPVDQRGGNVLAAPLVLDAAGRYYLQISGEGEVDSLALELIAPEVTQEGSKVIAVATPGDDNVILTLGSVTHVLNISGMEFTFDANEVHEFHVGSSTGHDQITVRGTSLRDTGRVLESRGTLNSSAYRVETYTFDETTFVGGGGHDYTQIYGSHDEDTLAGLPGDTRLTTPDHLIQMLGFGRVDAYGRGGHDYASVYGTQGDDLYYARDEYALLSGQGMMNYTKGFERVDAFGRGGVDIAQLFDSVANDEFVASPSYAYLIGASRTSYTKGFERVDAYSLQGGKDRAIFMDNEQAGDTFVARRGYAYMTDGHYLNYVTGFFRTRAFATGGTDLAQILDLKTGDAFRAFDEVASVLAADRDDEAKGFAIVSAAAGAGETPTGIFAAIDYALLANVAWI